jgi:hypothetical protein
MCCSHGFNPHYHRYKHATHGLHHWDAYMEGPLFVRMKPTCTVATQYFIAGVRPICSAHTLPQSWSGTYMQSDHAMTHSWDETYKQWPHSASQLKWYLYTQWSHSWSGTSTWSQCTRSVVKTIHNSRTVSDSWNKSYIDTGHTLPHSWTYTSGYTAGLRYPHWLYSASQLHLYHWSHTGYTVPHRVRPTLRRHIHSKLM